MKFREKTSGSVKEHDTSVISSNSYADSSVMSLLLLKRKDHVPAFESIMKHFEIEMVNIVEENLSETIMKCCKFVHQIQIQILHLCSCLLRLKWLNIVQL
jgi:hypothetical protein